MYKEIINQESSEESKKKCSYAQRLEQIFQFSRHMNKLLLEETSREEFTSGICNLLRKIDGYENSCLYFTQKNHDFFAAKNIDISKFINGSMPHTLQPLDEIVKDFIETGSKIAHPFYGKSQNPQPENSNDQEERIPVFSRVECLGNIYGILIVILDSALAAHEDQIHLIENLSEDIGQAFFHLDTSRKRRKMEGALRESEERYRNLFEYANDAIFLEAFTGDIRSVNASACKLLGYSRQELLTMNAKDFTPPGFEESMEELVELLKRRETIIVETQNIRKDGTVIDVEVSISHNEMNGEDFALVFVRDITERRKTQQEIIKLNKELEKRVQERTRELLQAKDELHKAEKLSILGQMAASVGHDLRNPLGAIKNSIYYLKKRHQDLDIKSIKHFDIMEKSIDYASNLIDELLHFSRQPQAKPERINLQDLIGYVLKTIHIPDNIETEVLPAGTNISIYGDRGKISRAILNILQNAFQAMQEGGVVQISIEKSEQWGIISIRDNGIGIKPEDAERIFDPFYTTKTKGTGLGLAIAKRYIELNNGEIEVESVPGKGSAFIVRLCLDKNEG